MSLTTRHLSARLAGEFYRPEPMIRVFSPHFGEIEIPIEDDLPDCMDPEAMSYRPAKRTERHSVVREIGFGGGASRPSSARRRKP